MIKKIDIYVIAGQSNALGISPVPHDAEKNNKTLSKTLIYQRYNINTDVADSVLKVRYGLGIDKTKFGLEIGAASFFASVKGKFGLIKYATDGTSLFDRWNAFGDGGEDFQNLNDTISAGLLNYIKLGFEPRIKSFLWMQGENDAIYTEQAQSYERNLEEFIKKIRLLYGEEIVIVLGQTNPSNPCLPFADKVNEAKIHVSERFRAVKYVKTDDLNKLIDNYHYSAENELELGKRMAECAFLAVGNNI